MSKAYKKLRQKAELKYAYDESEKLSKEELRQFYAEVAQESNTPTESWAVLAMIFGVLAIFFAVMMGFQYPDSEYDNYRTLSIEICELHDSELKTFNIKQDYINVNCKNYEYKIHKP